LLFTVTEIFLIPGRGIAPLPELKLAGEEKFKPETRFGSASASW
jgi:hypothetical protein